MTVDVPSSLTDLSRKQCIKLLATVRVGRVGVITGDAPTILPVNFLVLGGNIVFRTVPGTKLDAAAAHAKVAFEADNFAPDGTWGWSVLIRGIASGITDGAELESIRVELLRSWAFRDGRADRMVRITPSAMSGKGFGVALRALAPDEG